MRRVPRKRKEEMEKEISSNATDTDVIQLVHQVFIRILPHISSYSFSLSPPYSSPSLSLSLIFLFKFMFDRMSVHVLLILPTIHIHTYFHLGQNLLIPQSTDNIFYVLFPAWNLSICVPYSPLFLFDNQ